MHARMVLVDEALFILTTTDQCGQNRAYTVCEFSVSLVSINSIRYTILSSQWPVFSGGQHLQYIQGLLDSYRIVCLLSLVVLYIYSPIEFFCFLRSDMASINYAIAFQCCAQHLVQDMCNDAFYWIALRFLLVNSPLPLFSMDMPSL